MTAKLTPCTAKPMSETPSTGSYRRAQYNRETRSEPTSTRGCNVTEMNHGVALPTPSVTLVSLDGHVGRVQTANHR